ncbi:MAG: hypothetical protein KatS3mg082_2193 [Nitrospiraceae bacterium]|nr:MAG: hypothetical protein KatS3mg082_2193 [Nitrospiraceae bacterium]
MVDRTHRELTDEDIAKIAGTYHRGGRARTCRPGSRGGATALVRDVPGFCRVRDPRRDSEARHVLTPGRYVGAEASEDDGEPFEEKMGGWSRNCASSRPRR